MVLLRYDDHARNTEDVARAVHRLVRRKARVVEEDVLLRNARGCRILQHDLDLVVICLAVIARHQKLRRCALLVQSDALVQTVPQHLRRSPVRLDLGAKDHYAVRLPARGLGLIHEVSRSTRYNESVRSENERRHDNYQHYQYFK